MELVFGEIVTFFAFLDFKSNLKIGLRHVGKKSTTFVSCFEMRLHACMDHQHHFFNCSPLAFMIIFKYVNQSLVFNGNLIITFNGAAVIDLSGGWCYPLFNKQARPGTTNESPLLHSGNTILLLSLGTCCHFNITVS